MWAYVRHWEKFIDNLRCVEHGAGLLGCKDEHRMVTGLKWSEREDTYIGCFPGSEHVCSHQTPKLNTDIPYKTVLPPLQEELL